MRPLRLVLDPGHGGSNRGASGGEIVEREYVLGLAQRVERTTAWLSVPVECTLTRDKDTTIDLASRAAIANNRNADLVISLHCDAWTYDWAHGCHVFYRDKNDGMGQAVADAIASAWPRPLWRDGRATLADPGSWGNVVAAIKRYQCPAVLVECGYLTHKTDKGMSDSEAMRRPYVMDGAVAAILCGISRAYGLMED